MSIPDALADVWELDGWMMAAPDRWWDMDPNAPGLSCVLHGPGPSDDWNFDGEDPDDARAKAAAWVREHK